MSEYTSVMHVTSNEHGVEEITLESPVPMWRAVLSALMNRTCPTTVTETYVLENGLWVDKVTGVIAPQHKQAKLIRTKVEVRSMDLFDEFIRNR